MQEYDIAIIGAGPAGATLARLLRGFRVAVIDKKSHKESTFQKVCGGLLAPDAQKSLSRFQLELPLSVKAQPQIFSVRTIDLNSNIVRTYHRNYINMDRHKFDMWLISLIPDGVDLFLDTKCTDVRRESGGFKVDFLTDGIKQSLRTKYIVGADGAKSLVRRSFFKHNIQQYTAIQQWYKQDRDNPIYTAAFDSDITSSYAWGLEKDGYFIFGAALSGENVLKDFDVLKEKMKAYGYSFDGLVKTEACLVLSPIKLSDTLTGSEDIFLIGEAGGFISPSSLEGLSYAMDTAAVLADAFNKHFDKAFQIYKKRVFRLRLKLLSKRLKMPFMYNKTLRHLVMKSGLTAINEPKGA